MDSHSEHELYHEGHQRKLAQAVMRRQLSLSLKIAAIFIIILLGLPLVNYFMPGLANMPVGGFTLTWLFLAVLFYPVTWLLSWLFIRQSNEIEADIAATMRRGAPAAAGSGVAHTTTDVSSSQYVAAVTDADEPRSTDLNPEEPRL